MSSKKLSDILKDMSYLFCQDPDGALVRGIAYDSREVQKDYAFFALEGIHTDGHNYIKQAIESGASVIVHSKDLDDYPMNCAFVRVENTRRSLSPFSAAFYGHPSREIQVVGVTGTDGKSTTVWLISQLLELLDNKVGFLSTVNFKAGDELQKNHFRQSTPEAPEIHRFLRDMVDQGLDYAVIEATSHGLSEKNSRLADVNFLGAVFTNVTQEHLEFHGTLEQYRQDKANLFRLVADSDDEMAFGVVNADDPNAELFMEALGEKACFCYSMKDQEQDISARSIHGDFTGSEVTLVYPGGELQTRLNIPGKVNVENLMAAILTVMELEGLDPEDLEELIPQLKGVKGRMVPIHGKQPFQVYVDYAHTPGSFEKLLPSLKEAIEGRLIAVFGSAGERDIEKRATQGSIADQWCEIIILADEDPRLEDPLKILEDIAAGTKDRSLGENLFLIPDRREAMGKALDIAQEGDLVISLGKGHEGSIIYADGPMDWDEMAVMEELLRERGY